MNSIEKILSDIAFWFIMINFFYWAVMEGMRDFNKVAYAHARGACLIVAILILICV